MAQGNRKADRLEVFSDGTGHQPKLIPGKRLVEKRIVPELFQGHQLNGAKLLNWPN